MLQERILIKYNMVNYKPGQDLIVLISTDITKLMLDNLDWTEYNKSYLSASYIFE